MKLRIKGNSLRVRVSRSEVTRLLAGDRLEETINFTPEPVANFTYALQQDRLFSQLEFNTRKTKSRLSFLPTRRMRGAQPIKWVSRRE